MCVVQREPSEIVPATDLRPESFCAVLDSSIICDRPHDRRGKELFAERHETAYTLLRADGIF